MDTPENLVQLIGSESERLTQYLHTLSPEAWHHPSACEQWEVCDVVGHLTWLAEFFVDTVSRGVHGDTSVPAGRPPGDIPAGASFHTYIAQRAIAYREHVGEDLLPTFGTCYAQWQHLVTGRPPSDWDAPCAFWRGTVPVRVVLVQSIQELVIHGWDIRSRFEPMAQLSAESLPVLMGRIPARLGGSGYPDFRFDTQPPRPVCYRFALTGAAPSTHDILVENAKARMAPAGTATPHVTFHCATGTFVLMMYRRLTLEPVLAAGELVVEGDPGLTAAFDRWLKEA